MGEWRRKSWQGEQQGWFHQQQQQQQQKGGWPGPTTRPPGRPPPSPGSWRQTVPSWEKKFCTSVCSIPWKKLCETKKLMYMYENVVQWDDSAGEEAFHNAKARFWAEINGFYCDIPLPDPDKYIDVVNPNTVIDPQLVEDLYEQPPAADEREGGVTWDSFLFSDKPVPATGWGDEDVPVPTNDAANNITADPQSATWDKNFESGNASNSVTRVANCEKNIDSFTALNSEGKEINIEYTNNKSQTRGWGDGIVQDNSCASGWDDSWCNGRDNSGENWERWINGSDSRYGRKRDGGGHFGSGYMNTSYHVEACETNKNWRNCRGRKRTNDIYEQSMYDKAPLATQQWNSLWPCGPMNHQGSADSGGAWQWQKSVS